MSVLKQIEQQKNIDLVKGTKVRFEDCWTGQERTGKIVDYCDPLCWKIAPDKSYVRDNGEFAYAEDSTVRCRATGLTMADLVDHLKGA